METFEIKSVIPSRIYGDGQPCAAAILSGEVAGGLSRINFLWLWLSALILLSLMGCSSGGGGGAVSTTQEPVTAPLGSVQIAGRIKPVSTSLIAGTATPDNISMTVDEAAISSDGNSYETVVSGQTFDSAASPNSIIGAIKPDMATGSYDALKLSVSNMAWNANWTFANPSPCNGGATGSGSGSFDLSQSPMTLYFKTADLGGNSALYYQKNPPLSGYVGDADHPLILPAPIQVLQGETTTVSLVLETGNTLGCSHVSVFGRTDGGTDPNVVPQQEIVGSATQLFGATGLFVDAKQSDFVVTNGISSSLTTYPINGAMNPSPSDSIAGPETRLNGPSAIACYRATGVADDGCDEYIVLNRDDNSITTYSATAANNATPLRTIWGLFAGLSSPSGMALNLYTDPSRSIDPSPFESKDEILVANSGNDSITTYSRAGNGDTNPLRTLQGSLTGLDGACGVAIDKTHHEVFVSNSKNNTVTMYDLHDLDGSNNLPALSDGSIPSYGTINIRPLLTITNTGFSSPCGIVVDSGHSEMFIANKDGDSIYVFDLTAVPTPEVLGVTPATGPLALTPVRSIAGVNTGLHRPLGLQVASINGGQLWVTHNGGDAVMARAPRIIPVVSNSGAAANAVLSGDYNVVKFGIDLHKGPNGIGVEIPVIHAERGRANFDPQAANGPSFTFQRDSDVPQLQRQVMETGCGTPDHDIKDGIFGMAAGNTFYALTQDDQGVIGGSYLSNGDSFTGVSIDGDEMTVLYATKATGSTIPYLSGNGTDTGDPAYYAYLNYTNTFVGISRFLDPPKSDQFRTRLDVGYLYTQPTGFLTLFTDSNIVNEFDPMGDYNTVKLQAPRTTVSFRANSSGNSPTTLHAGGMMENQGYGMAGAITGNSQSFIFMNDITTLDSDLCQVTGGIGVGMRQSAPGTYRTSDIKGTYFIAGIGDDFQSTTTRDKYYSLSGTLTFDGGGTATLVQTKDSEGEISEKSTTFAYQVVPGMLPSERTTGAGPNNITADILSLYSSDSASTPYATALIGMDGKMLAIYQLSNTRLLGVGLLQNP